MTRYLVLAYLASLALPAAAGPTGLIVIPTTDVRGPGTYEVEWQHDGREGLPADAEVTFLNTQFGIVNRLEAGVDFCLSGDPDTDLFFNYKYSFPVRGFTVGVGTYNIGCGSKPVHYLVTGKSFERGSVNIGAQRNENSIQALLGAHMHFNRLILMTDYTSGDGNFSSAGFEYALSDRFAVQWGALFPNSGGGTQYTLHLIYNNLF